MEPEFTGLGPVQLNRCPTCGEEKEYPLYFFGGQPVLVDCPACHEAKLQRHAAAQAQAEYDAREKEWQEREWIFTDTDRSRLPARSTPTVLGWNFSRGNLIITGPTGHGKTRTMLELMHDLCVRDGHPCELIRFTEWKQALDKAHRYGGDGVEKFVRPYGKINVLGIDDLGHGRLNENNLSCLFELIDRRTLGGRHLTLITTQLDKAELRAAFAAVSQMTADAITRRLEQFFRRVSFDEIVQPELGLYLQ